MTSCQKFKHWGEACRSLKVRKNCDLKGTQAQLFPRQNVSPAYLAASGGRWERKGQEGAEENGSPVWTHLMLELEGSFIDREIEDQRGKVTWLMSYGFLFCRMTHWVFYRNSPYDRLCKKIKGIKKVGAPLRWSRKNTGLGVFIHNPSTRHTDTPKCKKVWEMWSIAR